ERTERQDKVLQARRRGHSPSPRAKREAVRQLPHPEGGAGHDEVGDIDRADEQDVRGAAPEQVQRGLHITDQQILERFNGGEEPYVRQRGPKLWKTIQV